MTDTRYASEEIRRRAEAEQAATAAALESTRKAKAEEMERELRARFLRSGGTEAEWTMEKKTILAEARKNAALGNEDAARASQRQMYRTF